MIVSLEKKKEVKYMKYLSRLIVDGRLEIVEFYLFGYKVFIIILVCNKGRIVIWLFYVKS